MKILFLFIFFALFACKKGANSDDDNGSNKGKNEDTSNNNKVDEGNNLDSIQVYVADPPRDSNLEKINIGIKTPDGSSAVGYRYALVNRVEQTQAVDVVSILMGHQQFVMRFLEKRGAQIFASIADDPAMMQKVRKVGMRIISNQKIVNKIISADGIDASTLTKTLFGLLTDMNSLNSATGDERKRLRNKIITTLGNISKNKALMTVIVDAMLEEKEFLSRIIREESLISSVFGHPEVLAAIMEDEEGKALSELIDIPSVVASFDDIFARLLTDDEFVDLVTEAKTRARIEKLMGDYASLSEELSKKKKNHEKIKKLRKSVNKEMRALSNNTALMGKIMSSLAVGTTSQTSSPPEVVGDPCEDAEYSDLVDLGVITTVEVGGIGKKTLCIVGYDSAGNEQNDPTRYDFAKTSVSTVMLSGALPASESTANSINVDVRASDESLVGYRYGVFHNRGNCPHDPSDYPIAVHNFRNPISATLLNSGLKILCVFGVDGDENMASVLAFHSWYYLPPVVQQPDDPPPSQPEQPNQPPPVNDDISLGRISSLVLSERNNYLYPAEDTTKSILIENVGSGTLSWSLHVNDNHSWLVARGGVNDWSVVGNVTDAAQQLGFMRGRIPTNDRRKVQFRLADTETMLYGRPYYREAIFTLRNNVSYFWTTFKVRFFIPKLKIYTNTILFSSQQPSATANISVQNIGEGYMKWDIVPVPHMKTWLNLRVERGGEKGSGILRLSLDRNFLPKLRGHYVQHYALFSNGDAVGAENCSYNVTSSFSGKNHVVWNTADCHDLRVIYTVE